MRDWGLNHNIFSLPVSGFISPAAELRLQLKLRMWHQTADSLSSWTDQNYRWGGFFWGSTTCYTHPLAAANTPDSHFLSLIYAVVQRLRLDILVSLDLVGEGKTKPAPNSDKWLMSKEYFLMLNTQKNDGRNQGGSFFLQKPFYIWHFWQMP